MFMHTLQDTVPRDAVMCLRVQELGTAMTAVSFSVCVARTHSMVPYLPEVMRMRNETADRLRSHNKTGVPSHLAGRGSLGAFPWFVRLTLWWVHCNTHSFKRHTASPNRSPSACA